MTNLTWPDMLADLTAKRDALNQMIELVRHQFAPETETPAPAVREKKVRRLKSVVKRERDTAAILAALRTKTPQRPGQLATVLKISRATLNHRITALVKSGAVVAEGHTANRQISLPRPRSVA